MPTETSEKYADIAENGLDSKYWDDIAQSLPWGNRSAESQMYVAGFVYGFYHDELLRLLGNKHKEILSDFEETGFFYWKDFFAERRARRPAIAPRTEKEKDVLKYGISSEYWDEVVRTLPWNSDSSAAKLYVAAKIYGYSHSEILNLISEYDAESSELGFFYWRDILEKIRETEVEPIEPDEEIDVIDIPYDRYLLVATYGYKRQGQFAKLFSPDEELNEDFLKAIHFNATHSMAGSTVTRSSMDGFIRGTLIGCIGAGIEQVKQANKSMQEEEAKIKDGTYYTEMAESMRTSAGNRKSLLSKFWSLFAGLL